MLHDRLLNLDEPVKIIRPDGTFVERTLLRTIATAAEALRERNDPEGLVFATTEIELTVGQP